MPPVGTKRVKRIFEKFKLSLGWLDEAVDNELRVEYSNVCSSERQVEFLLRHGYSVLQLKKMARRFAKMRKRHLEGIVSNDHNVKVKGNRHAKAK